MKRNVFLLILTAAFNLISGIFFAKNEQAGVLSPVISNNISNQQVTAFAEDEFGHIWISTIRGLNKFNVYEYHQYFSSEDSLSISDNRIQDVYNDSKNRLWVATVNGVCRYNEKECFDQVIVDSPSTNAFSFFENNDGKLFLNMNFQICIFNETKNKFQPVIDGINHQKYYTKCHVDKSNNIWVVTPGRVTCYNSHTYEIKDSLALSSYNTFSYLTDKGELWLASWNNLSIYDTRTGKYKALPDVIAKHQVLKNAIISTIFPYSKSSYLITTQNDGVFYYNYLTNEVKHQSENGFPFEVPDFEISTIFSDSQKNLWIGSFDQGYTVRYSYKERFNNNNYLRSKLEGLSVSSISPDHDNNLWIVNRSRGVMIYRSDNHEIDTFSNDEIYSFWNNFQHKAKKIFIDSQNNIWLLSDWMLVCARYENNKLVVKMHQYFPKGIMSIDEDIRGTLWLGGKDESIYNRRKDDAEFKPFNLYGREFTFTPHLISLSSGKVLIASFNSDLQLIDPDNWGVSTIPIKNKMKSSSFIPVYLFEDTAGDVWIGTITNGIFKYQTQSGFIVPVEGISCSDISSITEDISGNIWVSTLNGLSKYDRTTNQFMNYYQTDGIGGNQFNEQSVCRMPDNTLIFGGTHGLTSFNPIDLTYRRNIPLFFESLKIHNQLVSPVLGKNISKSMVYNPNITLKHNQNSFTISFAALDYCEFERVKYSYKLEGFDNMWIEANNNRQAFYSNIPAGKYTFKVKIYNNENTIAEAENEVKLKVKPAPWFSWPAIFLYLLVFEFLLVFLIRMQRRIKANKDKALLAEREKEQEQKVNKMNMSFFANLSHEFRTPLTMISGPISILSNDESIGGEKKQLIYIVQRSVNRMLRLVNQLMDFNKLENDTLKLKVKLTDIVDEVKRPIDVFKLNAKEKGIELSTYGFEDSFVMWLDADKLEKITANLISNALKFSGPDGKIGVSFDVITREKAETIFPLTSNDVSSQYVKIAISDTGKGIPDDKLEKIFERYFQLDNQTKEFYNWGTGIGLYYARCLVELHHGFIKAANRSEGGAVFTFILPVSELAYSAEERKQNDEESTKNLPVLSEQEYLIETREIVTGKQKLLIIDDDTDIVHYLKTILVPYFDVTYKFDADLAYKSLKESEPDLILCDVVMPGTDGYTFSRKVKENLSYCHIPIILVTAKATVENQVEGLNSGADAYVTKPFDPTYLLALINSQLNNRKKVQSLLGSTTKTERIEKDILTPQDNSFMTSLYDLMENELSNPELNVNRMTEVLNISRTKFYYKVKGLTGDNPNVFFKTYKLNRAAELLLEGKNNISEIADITGFSTLSHFSVSFKKQFGVSPRDYNKMV